ncbi:MAG: histidine phosphatase family protein [Propioniciclava sp.]|uniref:histidine phosphatase family protein n=1 Tax=Propioniciclava sp. TaxID=2038686 RepID=UPI0039E302BA
MLVSPGTGASTPSTPSASAVTCGPDHKVSLYLARHGKTMLNTVDLSQGWIDAPLTPVGIEGAEALGRGIKDVPFDAAYSSDSGRAIETAGLVLTEAGQSGLIAKLVQDKRLREYNFGTFEGKPNDEMVKEALDALGTPVDMTTNYADVIKPIADQLAKLDAAKVEPGVNWPAETYDAVATRAKEGLDSIAADAAKKCQSNVLIVSHGMTITTIAAELGAKDKIPAGGPKNSSVTLLSYSGGNFTVESFGDTSYLEKGQNK